MLRPWVLDASELIQIYFHRNVSVTMTQPLQIVNQGEVGHNYYMILSGQVEGKAHIAALYSHGSAALPALLFISDTTISLSFI